MMKNKKIRLPNRLLVAACGFLYMLLAAYLIFFSTTMFYTGYHNLDLSQNMISVEYYTGLDIKDMASDHNIYEYQDMYVTGFNQMKEGFYLGIVGGLCLGLAVFSLLYLHDVKQ